MLVRMMIVAIAMMIVAPSAMKGATTTINFDPAGTAAQKAADGDTSYETNFEMGEDYSAIGYGAKVGVRMNYRNHSSAWTNIDISRLAFIVNTNGRGNAHIDGDGFYLRRDTDSRVRKSGLYNSKWSQKLAVLNLKPGDKVTFVYCGSSNIDNDNNGNGNANLHDDTHNQWLTQIGIGQTATRTIEMSSIGDLIVSANKGTIIQSITIESNVAEYDITTSGNTTTFEFKKGGYLEENDFALPYMSVSFGNKNDYLVVGDDKQSRMFKSDGTETLQTDANIDWQPVAGNFYAFRPTGGGTVTVEGGLQGSRTHLFVYNNGWEGADGNIYKDTYNTDDDHYISFSFEVEKGKTYYICINNQDNNEHGNAFHLHKFSFTNTFHLNELAKVVDLSTVTGDVISLTHIEGAQGLGSNPVKVKRQSGNIKVNSVQGYIDANGWLTITKPQFEEGTDNAGTVILDIDTQGGEATFVVTFPYHADFNPAGYTDTNRTYGHTWNFIDPRNSDSNIGNCWIHDGYSTFNLGTTTGILSLGQYKTPGSQMRKETDNREWTFSQRQTGSSGGGHDPYYMNVFDMEGDNADMIWETEGLWFDTGTNLSCIYNENDAYDQSLTNPLDFKTLGTDPDRYVGLLPVTDDKKSSFTIPGLKPGDRVLIFMKSGEGSGANGIFLNISGAKDALGTPINSSDLYKAGGTNWQHSRYEGCYHFIKDETTDEGSDYGRMTFDMQAGSMCKLMYIRIYTGQRIVTTNIVSQTSDDAGKLLFINDKGATLGSAGSGSQMSLRFRGKGQHSTNQVLTYSGNLNAASFTGDNFKVTGAYNHLIDFKSKVGEIGMFRLRMNDITYEYEKSSDQKITYVADFCDRNFTVGYRDKVDSYPYTWDFTDIQGFSSSKMDAEADNYPIAAAANDAYGYEWDISLFDADGNMKVNTGWDPITNNLIFSPHKIGFGNQLWAGGNVIPETRGLWFYSEDDSETGYTSEYSSTLYNDCLQITSDGIRFANVPDQAGKRVAWWNYKMVVPDVPADGAVYLRMKRDISVPDDAKTFSTIDNADVPFVATRFKFASQSAKTEVFTTTEVKGNGDYAFYKVPNTTTNEWILAVKNTTGNVEHLTFTLNGWIVKKVAVSTDAKTVNRLGWATESRARVIDPALTSEMTGYPFETYIVTDANYANKTVTLQPVKVIKQAGDTEKAKVMPAVEVNEDGTIIESTLKNAYIIRNTKLDDERIVNNIPEPGRVQILNNGFHLFVPDMHDYVANRTDNIENQKEENVMTNNMLVSLLTAGTVVNKQGSGNIYNYALTSQKNKVGDDTQTYLDEIGFYRIKDGTKSSGNQGYLPVDCTVPTGTTDGGGAKMSIIFDSFDDPAETVETAIEVPFEKVFGGSDAVYYNLNGQKLSGKPTQGGLYIVNGKKVMVK